MNPILENAGAATVVTLRDDSLDGGNAKEFRARMEAALPAGGLVLIDFENVRFIDSSGLGAILACLRRMESAGGVLRLCGVRPAVRTTLELVRMDRLLEIHPTRADALAGVRGADVAAPAPGACLLLRAHDSGDVTVAVAEGDTLDADRADGFRRQLDDLLLERRKVLLDLSAVAFADSTGLGAILGCLHRAAAAGGELRVCGLRPLVQQMFEVLRLDRLVDVHASRDEGLRAFAAARV